MNWLVKWGLSRCRQPKDFQARIHPSAECRLAPDAALAGSRMDLAPGAVLRIGRGSRIQASISLGPGCQMEIGENCVVENVEFSAPAAARIQIGDRTRLRPPPRWPIVVLVDRGVLEIGSDVWVQSQLLVRFGGHMTIGAFVGIGYGGDVRCEERVAIGDYALISYEVCIYDTNTHSVDWRQRRAAIERMRATGAGETEKPDTRPVWIGNDVWIGRGATILKGSQIGDRSIVGIRTVVSGVHPPDTTLVSPPPRALAREGAR